MDKEINAFLVFGSETDVERWMNSKNAFFRETRSVISEGNEYILNCAKTLYEEYLKKNNICENSRIEVDLDNSFHPDAGNIFGKVGIGAGIAAAAAALLGGPVGWVAALGGLFGGAVSKKDELDVAKKILVENSLMVAKAYADHLNKIISSSADVKKEPKRTRKGFQNAVMLPSPREQQSTNNERPPSYLEIDDLKKNITHNIYGIGILESFDHTYATIKFGVGVKKIDYKLCFNKGVLTLNDPEAMRRVSRCIEYYDKNKICSTKNLDDVKAKIIADKENSAKKEILQSVSPKLQEIQVDEKNSDDGKRLISLWKKYGFEGFLHTTEIENFEKIVKCGALKSRLELEENGTLFNDKANQEIIGHTNSKVKQCCRFYYYFRTPTNYRANYSRPIIMVFDPNIIYSGRSMYFYNGNAASAKSTYTSSIKGALQYDWEGIFERASHTFSKSYDPYDEACSEKITRARNAEFLCESPLSISNIIAVYFKNEDDLNDAKKFCPPMLWEKFKCDRSKFS